MGKVYHYGTYEESVEKILSRSVTLDISLRRGPCRGHTVRLPFPPDCRNRYHGDERQDLDRKFHMVVPLGEGRTRGYSHDCQYSYWRPRATECVSHDDAGPLYDSAAFASDGGCGVYALRHRNDLGGPQAAPECGHPIRYWGLHQLVPRTFTLARRELRCIQRNERENVCLTSSAPEQDYRPQAGRESRHRECGERTRSVLSRLPRRPQSDVRRRHKSRLHGAGSAL